MKSDELSYDLPEDLVAQRPLEARDASRLMVVDRPSREVEDHEFGELPELLHEPSLLVVNDSRVIPARLVGARPTGGRVELLLVRRLEGGDESELWLCIGRPRRKLRPGTHLTFAELEGEVRSATDEGVRVTLSARHGSVADAIERCGKVPLPPYIRREPEPADRQRYQTLHARSDGSVAAPTAGLHFTPAVRQRLEAAGHRWAAITLHVGPGTFLPVRTDDLAEHHMHEELYDVSEGASEAIATARRQGRRVVAVGTTVVRALETAASAGGGVLPGPGESELFITPGFEFQVVEGLVTNFHLPRSTLLALVFALAGRDLTLSAYRHAVEERYRFYSYGDAMLIR